MAISPVLQRVAAGAVLLPAAALSLPVSAALLDHPEGRENWILPAQGLGMAAIGAGIGAALPHAFTSSGARGKAALIGAGAALGAAVLADVALFALITDR
jgi:hypothetical protein